MPITKSQIDKLGERLRAVDLKETDLRLLDQFRRSFAHAYDTAVSSIRDDLGLEPTGRPAKSTAAIREKLRRESIRLSQMQDVAGCRLVVADRQAQERVVGDLMRLFPGATVLDRRAHPSHGYRAVHVIPTIEGMPIEVQVRTQNQHMWAEYSEKIADILDAGIKYGGGPAEVRTFLDQSSQIIESIEQAQMQMALYGREPADEDMRQELEGMQQDLRETEASLREVLEKALDELNNISGDN